MRKDSSAGLEGVGSAFPVCAMGANWSVFLPVWNLRKTRKRLMNERAATCDHGYSAIYADRELKISSGGLKMLRYSTRKVAKPKEIRSRRRRAWINWEVRVWRGEAVETV